MLKIKDNVDLKELEKFGFKKQNITPNEIELLYNNIVNDEKEYQEYYHEDRCIIKYDRELWLSGADTIPFGTNSPESIYDLIQAGLVEKV